MAHSKSDEEVITQERKRVQRGAYLQYGGMLFLVVLAGWAYLPVPRAWRLAASPYEFYVVAAGFAVMLVYALGFVGVPSTASQSERLIPRQIDGYLTQARRQWLLLIAMLLAPVAGASRMIATIDEGVRVHRLPADYAITHSSLVSAALLAFAFFLSALSFALPLTWFKKGHGQALEDELVQELRAKALKIGYVGAVAAMAAGYVVVSVTPLNPLQWLVWAGYAVVALPVLAFTALEAQAGRSD